jgi:CopG family nickel-responsive transcriptional regulator
MPELKRIGVALNDDLLDQFDELMGRRGYTNRSEAFRDLIRAELVNEAAQSRNARVVGTLTLVYDHHVRLLTDKLNSVQHDHHDLIISTMHTHLDHDNCLEVIVLRGKAVEVQTLADTLLAVKGVKHGRLVVAASETPLP